jgi:hypothetical protein
MTKQDIFSPSTSCTSHIFPPSTSAAVFFSHLELRSLVHLGFRSEILNPLQNQKTSDFGTSISLRYGSTQDTKTKETISVRRSAYRTILHRITKQKTDDFGTVISLPHDPTQDTNGRRFWDAYQLIARSYRAYENKTQTKDVLIVIHIRQATVPEFQDCSFHSFSFQHL